MLDPLVEMLAVTLRTRLPRAAAAARRKVTSFDSKSFNSALVASRGSGLMLLSATAAAAATRRFGSFKSLTRSGVNMRAKPA